MYNYEGLEHITQLLLGDECKGFAKEVTSQRTLKKNMNSSKKKKTVIPSTDKALSTHSDSITK